MDRKNKEETKSIDIKEGAAYAIIVSTFLILMLPLIVGPIPISEFNFFSSGYFFVTYGVYIVSSWLLKIDIYWGPVISHPSSGKRVIDLILGLAILAFGYYEAIGYWIEAYFV